MLLSGWTAATAFLDLAVNGLWGLVLFSPMALPEWFNILDPLLGVPGPWKLPDLDTGWEAVSRKPFGTWLVAGLSSSLSSML